MYNSYFGFTESPFNVTPNPRFFYRNTSYDDVMTVVQHAIENRKGITVVTGEPGTGKTLLLKFLVQILESKAGIVTVRNPNADFSDLLGYLLDRLNIPAKPPDTAGMLNQISAYLKEQRRNGRVIALLIDEAQNLSDKTLEDLRLLSDLESENEPLLAIVLVGQPEVNDRLDHPSARRLKQCVVLNRQMYPMIRKEIEPYIDHRLQVAQYKGQLLFAPETVEKIARLSKGIPRTVNVLCDNALLKAYMANQSVISLKIVEQVARELRIADPWQSEWKHPSPAIGAANVNVGSAANGVEPVNGAINPSKEPILLTHPIESPIWQAEADDGPTGGDPSSRYPEAAHDSQTNGYTTDFSNPGKENRWFAQFAASQKTLSALGIGGAVRGALTRSRLRWLGIAAIAGLVLLTIGSIVRSKQHGETYSAASIADRSSFTDPWAARPPYRHHSVNGSHAPSAAPMPAQPQVSDPKPHKEGASLSSKLIKPTAAKSDTVAEIRAKKQQALQALQAKLQANGKPEREDTAKNDNPSKAEKPAESPRDNGKPSKPTRETLKVVAASLLRSQPSAKASIVATLEPGSRVRVLGETRDYFQVSSLENSSVRGYVHREDAFFERKNN